MLQMRKKGYFLMINRNALGIAVATLALGLAGAASAEAFNGPYVGAQLGWQQDRVKSTLGNVAGLDQVLKDKKSAVLGGGFIGYNAKLGEEFVLGGEVGLDFGGKTTDFRAFGADGDIKAKRTLTVAARLGALITPETMVYAKGGYGNTRYRANWDIDSAKANRDGYVLGLGVEQALAPNVSARLEYLHSNYGKANGLFQDVGLVNASKTSLKRNQVTAGIAFNF